MTLNEGKRPRCWPDGRRDEGMNDIEETEILDLTEGERDGGTNDIE